MEKRGASHGVGDLPYLGEPYRKWGGDAESKPGKVEQDWVWGPQMDSSLGGSPSVTNRSHVTSVRAAAHFYVFKCFCEVWLRIS